MDAQTTAVFSAAVGGTSYICTLTSAGVFTAVATTAAVGTLIAVYSSALIYASQGFVDLTTGVCSASIGTFNGTLSNGLGFLTAHTLAGGQNVVVLRHGAAPLSVSGGALNTFSLTFTPPYRLAVSGSNIANTPYTVIDHRFMVTTSVVSLVSDGTYWHIYEDGRIGETMSNSFG